MNHRTVILGRIDDKHQAVWNWRCESCGQRGTEWTTNTVQASESARLHELYPDGLGDADAVLAEWSRKR